MQGSPPSNAGFMVAAYVVTAVIVLVYALGLWSRARKALSEHRAASGAATPPAP